MRSSMIVLAAAILLASCGNDAAEADRRAGEALGRKREADNAAKERLLDGAGAAARKAVAEVARTREAKASEGVPIGPISAVAGKEPAPIVARALELMGGRDKVAAIRAVSGRAELKGAVDQRYDFAIEYPGRMAIDFEEAGETTRALIVDGGKAFDITRGRITELVEPILADTLLSIRGDPLCLMITLATSAEDHQLTYLGRADVGGRPADALRVQPPRSKEILAFFDVETGRLLATRYEMSQGLVTVIDEKTETVGGVAIGVVSRQIVGSRVSIATVSDVAINPKLQAERFAPLQHPLMR